MNNKKLKIGDLIRDRFCSSDNEIGIIYKFDKNKSYLYVKWIKSEREFRQNNFSIVLTSSVKRFE